MRNKTTHCPRIFATAVTAALLALVMLANQACHHAAKPGISRPMIAEIPADFPTADKVSLRQEPMLTDVICKYDFGRSRKALAIIEENIRTAAPAELEEIEIRLLEVLESPDATYAGKLFACRMLRRMGSARSVPALAKLLDDEKLSDPARFALQGLPSPKVDKVFRESLKNLMGDLRIGVIGSIAARGDRKAVSQLARLLKSKNKALARAAISALGQIGGKRAARALSRAKVIDEVEVPRDDACLLCADRMLAEGKMSDARAIYRRMAREDHPTMVRVAAYRGLVQAQKENAVPTILALLENENSELRRVAGRLMPEIPGTTATKAFAERIPSLSSDAQIVVLGALSTRADKAALPAVAEAAKGGDETVRIAAIRALAVLGDTTTVELLASAAASGDGVGKAAADSLRRLSGDGVDAAILKCMQNRDARIRAAVIRVMITRRSIGTVPALLKFAEDPDATVCHESLKGLASLADEKDMPALVNLLVKVPEKHREAAEEAVLATSKRMDDSQQRTEYLLAGLPGASAPARASLLRLLGEFGGEKAFEAVKDALKDEDEGVRDAAISALVDWPDAMPMATLLQLAKSSTKETPRLLTLRGYLRMVALPSSRSAQETLEKYKAAMAISTQQKEKKMVLDAVSKTADFARLEFLENYLEDEVIGADAQAAYRAMLNTLRSNEVDRGAWKVTASHNNGNAKNAIDGRRRTRWDTGKSQTSGEWFVIDMGSEKQVTKIVLDAARSTGDYPRGYEVYVSNDGKNWGEPVAKGAGQNALTEIPVPSKRGRYIKIVQTGRVDGLHWSIHELKVFQASDEARFKHATEVLERVTEK